MLVHVELHLQGYLLIDGRLQLHLWIRDGWILVGIDSLSKELLVLGYGGYESGLEDMMGGRRLIGGRRRKVIQHASVGYVIGKCLLLHLMMKWRRRV